MTSLPRKHYPTTYGVQRYRKRLRWTPLERLATWYERQEGFYRLLAWIGAWTVMAGYLWVVVWLSQR